MSLEERALLRRRHIKAEYGVSDYIIDEMVRAGSLSEVHLRFDDEGEPVDRAHFKRSEVVDVMGGSSDH